MRRLLSILLTLCMVMTIFTLPVAADGEISLDEAYFTIDGEEILQITQGNIKPKLVVSNSGAEKEVNVISALYNGDRLEAVQFAEGTLLAENITTLRLPSISVTSIEGRELRAFLWEGGTIAPLAKYKKIDQNPAEELESITLVCGDDRYEGTINAETKEITFNLTSFVMGTGESALPDSSNAYFETEGVDLKVSGELDFSAPVTLMSAGNGPTIKYTAKSKNTILQKHVDFEGASISGTTFTSTTDKGQAGTYTLGDFTEKAIVDRPKSGSDEKGEGKAIYLKTDKKAVSFLNTAQSDNEIPPTKADEITFSFDMRIDDMSTFQASSGNYIDECNSEGAINVYQGVYYTSQGANIPLAFGQLKTNKTLDKSKEYVAFLNIPGSISNFDEAPVLKFKQWYNFKTVTRVDRDKNTYETDFYIDGAYIATKSINLSRTGLPSGRVSGSGVNNFRVSTMGSGTYYEAYFDNFKTEFSYGTGKPAVYMIGDNTMAEYSATRTFEIQGFGTYIQDNFSNDIKFVNMARAGHSASTYVEGGTYGDTYYQADWQHIKSMLKEGDYVLISVGANDVAYGTSGSLSDNVKEIIREAKAAGAEVLVCSQTPVGGNAFTENATVKEALSAAASAEGVPFIALGESVKEMFESEIDAATENTAMVVSDKYYCGFDKDNDNPDFVNLKPEGAEMVAEKLAELIIASNSSLRTYAKNYVDTPVYTDDKNVYGATLTLGNETTGVYTFDGTVKTDTKEITFYVPTFKNPSWGMSKTDNTKYRVNPVQGDKFAEAYPTLLKSGIVNIQTGAMVDKNGIAVDLSDGEVYTIGSTDAWSVSAVEVTQYITNEFGSSFRTESDRAGLPSGTEAYYWWDSKKSETVSTKSVSGPKGGADKAFNIASGTEGSTNEFYATYFREKGWNINGLITEFYIKFSDLNEGKGFYAGFYGHYRGTFMQNSTYTQTNRSGLVFTRSGRNVTDSKIDIKYVPSYANRTTLNEISAKAVIDFDKWYKVKTVVTNTLQENSKYLATTQVYLNDEYVGSYSGEYAKQMQLDLIVGFGAWKDGKTTYNVSIDKLKVYYPQASFDELNNSGGSALITR